MTGPDTRKKAGTRDRRSVSPVWLLAFAAVTAYGCLTALHEGNSYRWTVFADGGEVLAALLATIACVFRARTVRRTRRKRASTDNAASSARRPAWALLACGAGLWLAGELCVCIYEIGLNTRVPEPSVADVFFLLSFLFVIVGLLAFVRTPAGLLSQLRGAVEAMCIACGFVLCSWSLVIGPVLAENGPLDVTGLVNLAYPVLDSVALAAVFFVALRRRMDPPAGLSLLAAGIILWTLSDSSWWYLGEVEPNLPSVTPVETGWVAGFALLALAAWRKHQPRVWAKRPADSRFVLSLPALPGFGGGLILLATWLVNGRLQSSGVLLGIVGVFMMLSLTLLVIVIHENDALTSDLERRVDERTAELHRTERYYRALVEHSSDLVVILDPDLQIRYASESCQSLFGYEPSQLVGHGLDVFGSDAQITLTDALQRPSAGHESTPVAWTLTDASGRTRSAESTITNLIADADVGGFVLNTRDDTDRAALAEQLQDQAFHDPLTGLANRALLRDRATQALARAQRSATAVGMLAIDLDSFKLVNDGFGHDAGDQLLCAVAERLAAAVRPEDTVARLGDDEFVVLMDPAPAAAAALELAARVQAILREDVSIDGVAHKVSASIGVALGSTPHTDFDQLLSDAEVALYCVKQAGRDDVQLFDTRMNTHARERFELQADLRHAIDAGQLLVYYQPECAAGSCNLEGFEALVRWQHPEHGLMAPDRFIPLAEETGLIVPLGRWVLRHALAQASRWSNEHARARSLTIAVNVSAVQLKAPSILTDVEDALNESGIDPARVVLEVTESSFIESSEEMLDTLRALRELGVRLAIDDFGTGYTSIANLQSMPIDILKIDRCFVVAADESADGGRLLDAVVNIGRVLSLTIVAEGIEECRQLEAVRELGCDLVQGFLFSRPVPAEQAELILSAAPSWLTQTPALR
jgi:diguanylate cyclase (GGDEF)-like protein/PAS domain S-box-containing protein